MIKYNPMMVDFQPQNHLLDLILSKPNFLNRRSGVRNSPGITSYDNWGYDSGLYSASSEGDAGLAEVVGAWPSLPETVRAGILAMIAAIKEAAGEAAE